ncbi:MAG: hypothetical protein OEZ36_10080 [Spirochaetota bacterium]|nr:hypothetical protein [Spirochaetota bacterium]
MSRKKGKHYDAESKLSVNLELTREELTLSQIASKPGLGHRYHVYSFELWLCLVCGDNPLVQRIFAELSPF